ncbi:WXG100 family type VII secretion target [Streptomyces sp. NPDC001770]
MGEEPKLAYTSAELRKLADDLDGMRDYLGAQVRRMDEIVDSVESGWQGPTATSYRSLHRGAAEDAVRIGQKIQLLAEAVRLSEGGFTEQELDALERFRAIQVDADVEAAADALSTPTPGVPRSSLKDF